MKKLGVLLAALFVVSLAQPVQPAAGATVVSCTWLTPEYPHISSFNLQRNGTVDIKTSTQGECQPATDPVFVTAQMTLERRGFLGIYSDYASGPPIEKSIQGTGQVWRRGELIAVAPCVPGTYRGRLTRSARVAGGIAVLIGNDIVSPPREIDCKPKRVAMVIDDTGSMGEEIGSVVSALSSYIRSQPEDEYTSWNLTTFKDSVSNVGTTEDRAEALALVNGLTASGGGDCPEEAIGAISSGLSSLGSDPTTDKQMLVATDASAQNGDVAGVISRARANGVRVNVLLTGDCGSDPIGVGSAGSAATDQGGLDLGADEVTTQVLSSQVVLRQIAEETGGKYFYIPGGTAEEFTEALDEIFEEIANPETGEPLADLTVEVDGVAYPGEPVDVTAEFTGGEAPFTVDIDWGDGSACPGAGTCFVDPMEDRMPGIVDADYTYAEPGVYEISVTVTDATGASVTSSVVTADCTIVGTAGRDTLIGTAGADVICGLGGNDRIFGLGDDDILIGGSGRDRLDGGPGNDTLYGGSEADQMFGRSGMDLLLGGKGNDVMRGGTDDDEMNGRLGSDRMFGEQGDDVMAGNRGNDTLNGNDGNDVLQGRRGTDRLFGGRGDDELSGGQGRDTLNGSAGDDDLSGGSGADALIGGGGDDQMDGGDGRDRCVENQGFDTLVDCEF